MPYSPDELAQRRYERDLARANEEIERIDKKMLESCPSGTFRFNLADPLTAPVLRIVKDSYAAKGWAVSQHEVLWIFASLHFTPCAKPAGDDPAGSEWTEAV